MKNIMSRLENTITKLHATLRAEAKCREEAENSIEEVFLRMLDDAYVVLTEDKTTLVFKERFSQSRTRVDFGQLYHESPVKVKEWLSFHNIDHIVEIICGEECHEFSIHYQPKTGTEKFQKIVTKIFQTLLAKAKAKEEQDRLDKIYGELLEEKFLEMLDKTKTQLHPGTWINPDTITFEENFLLKRAGGLDFDRVYRQNPDLANSWLKEHGIECSPVDEETPRGRTGRRGYKFIITCKPLL